MLEHLRLLSRYNQWMNDKLYNTLRPNYLPTSLSATAVHFLVRCTDAKQLLCCLNKD